MIESTQPALPAITPSLGTLDPAEPRWTPARMADFIAELAATQSVALAARSVGMSRQSAYRLRGRQTGAAFDIAWAIALEQGFDQLYRAALARAVGGTEVPVYQRGELVGTRRHYDERLTCFLLAHGKQRSKPMRRELRMAIDDSADRFEDLIEQIRAGAPEVESEAG